MPKTKKFIPTFLSYFKDIKKLVNIIVSFKFKESFSRNRGEASKKVIQVYKQKNYVQEKEIAMFKKAWMNNTGGIQETYEKVFKGLFKQHCFQ